MRILFIFLVVYILTTTACGEKDNDNLIIEANEYNVHKPYTHVQLQDFHQDDLLTVINDDYYHDATEKINCNCHPYLINIEDIQSHVKSTEHTITENRIISFITGGVEIDIQYPWIREIKNDSFDIVNKINEMIHDLVITPYTIGDYMPGCGMVKIDYEITFSSDEILSIRFFGDRGGWYGTGKINKGITFDLSFGHSLSLCNFFTLEKSESLLISLINREAACFSTIYNYGSEEENYLFLYEYFEFALLYGGWPHFIENGFFITEEALYLAGIQLPHSRWLHPMKINFNES
jgi:hypothetical protein